MQKVETVDSVPNNLIELIRNSSYMKKIPNYEL